MTGTDGPTLPRASTAASITRVCVATRTFGTSCRPTHAASVAIGRSERPLVDPGAAKVRRAKRAGRSPHAHRPASISPARDEGRPLGVVADERRRGRRTAGGSRRSRWPGRPARPSAGSGNGGTPARSATSGDQVGPATATAGASACTVAVRTPPAPDRALGPTGCTTSIARHRPRRRTPGSATTRSRVDGRARSGPRHGSVRCRASPARTAAGRAPTRPPSGRTSCQRAGEELGRDVGVGPTAEGGPAAATGGPGQLAEVGRVADHDVEPASRVERGRRRPGRSPDGSGRRADRGTTRLRRRDRGRLRRARSPTSSTPRRAGPSAGRQRLPRRAAGRHRRPDPAPGSGRPSPRAVEQRLDHPARPTMRRASAGGVYQAPRRLRSERSAGSTPSHHARATRFGGGVGPAPRPRLYARAP